MVGIAEMLINQGFSVSGSDLIKNKNTNRLDALGAKIFIGHNEKNVRDADVVVYSSAVSESNPEIKAAKSLNITLIPRAEMLSSLMRGFQSIAVAGSHGKTTTTSLLADIFMRANLDPTFIIGGKILGQENKSILGSSEYLIVEADESDASFLHLSPEISVITNIDNDHLDFY
jgi:UDP-N-acetylmuramate--alanine ligase